MDFKTEESKSSNQVHWSKFFKKTAKKITKIFKIHNFKKLVLKSFWWLNFEWKTEKTVFMGQTVKKLWPIWFWQSYQKQRNLQLVITFEQCEHCGGLRLAWKKLTPPSHRYKILALNRAQWSILSLSYDFKERLLLHQIEKTIEIYINWKHWPF